MRLWLEQLILRVRYRDPKQRACMSLRRSMAALGAPVWDYTDDDLERSAIAASQEFHRIGLNAEGLDRFAQAVARIAETPQP